MTDVRQEFQKWWNIEKKNPIPDYGQESLTYDIAFHGWQACQSLNDKRIENYKIAYDTWQEKTEWVQDTAKANEIGMHRADVLRQRINDADKRIADLLAVIAKKDEALKLSAAVFSGEISDKSGMIKSLELLREALAIKPENVELVESK